MKSTEMFTVLDSTDSTNNYAMAMVHAGMAKHGMAWFAREQKSGKGQQGKSWESLAGQNIALSIVIKPRPVFFQSQFYFSAAIANTCCSFLKRYAGNEARVKWPNDLYWGDRKAGGILIENKFKGKAWDWAVVGIGVNVNQVLFGPHLPNPVSMKQITGKTFDPELLARELYGMIMQAIDGVSTGKLPLILDQYNANLYKKGKKVQLKKDNAVFETEIRGVNEFGQLLTKDVLERQFNFGEVNFQVP